MEKFKEFGFSRFIRSSDVSSGRCIFNIPAVWWSRRYEYPWAMKFAEKDDICLDAGGGVEHNLKFYLAKHCKEVYCCDLDKRILNKESVLSLAKQSCDEKTYKEILYNIKKIVFDYSKLSNLKYSDKFFDKIYCISALEHLENDTLISTLKEFRRVLKDQGIIIATFDYPIVNLKNISKLIDEAGLKFAYGVDFNFPSDCLESSIYKGLKCFRAVLCTK